MSELEERWYSMAEMQVKMLEIQVWSG